jgi:biopolymer transport protein ExbD
MKFPRNARIFRGQLDFAPFAAVLLLLVVFVLLGKTLYTPGIPVRLPAAGDVILPGATGPTLSVAVTTNAFYFQDQLVPASELSNRLFAAKQKFSEPVTLIVQADEEVTRKQRDILWSIARQVGFTNLLEATLPRVYDPSAARSTP